MCFKRFHCTLCVLAALCISILAPAQIPSKQATAAPAEMAPPHVVSMFAQKVGTGENGEVILKQARESLWEVYPEGDALKDELVQYVKKGKDGPGLAFAGLALIPFHDPATVRPMLERAMDVRTSTTTRWYFLNAAPYVLGMGDVMYSSVGKRDKESLELADGLMKFSGEASRVGLGHAHALQLQELFNAPAATKKDEDYGLAVWHTSAYLLGTLDLKDEAVLAPALTSNSESPVFGNVIGGLCYASNRDFVSGLRSKRGNEVTLTMVQTIGKASVTWWQEYLKSHPDGNNDDAVISGFREAGYAIEPDRRSALSRRELLRALDDQSRVIRANAHRSLNRIYGTHFDLDIAFFRASTHSVS